MEQWVFPNERICVCHKDPLEQLARQRFIIARVCEKNSQQRAQRHCFRWRHLLLELLHRGLGVGVCRVFGKRHQRQNARYSAVQQRLRRLLIQLDRMIVPLTCIPGTDLHPIGRRRHCPAIKHPDNDGDDRQLVLMPGARRVDIQPVWHLTVWLGLNLNIDQTQDALKEGQIERVGQQLALRRQIGRHWPDVLDVAHQPLEQRVYLP